MHITHRPHDEQCTEIEYKGRDLRIETVQSIWLAAGSS